MTGFVKFLKSSVGAKIVMAVTGLMLLGFIVIHLAGNLNMYFGPKAMNDYALFLKRDVGKALWIARLGLLAAVVLHIGSAIRLAQLNRQARPVRYQNPHYSASSYASRTMVWSGVIVLSFLLYHLLHFTFGVVQHDHYILKTAQGHHDVYRMVILGFKSVVVSGFYILAQVLLAFHLSHGISSFFQSLGLNNEKYRDSLKKVGPAFATVTALGYISIPVSVLLGLLK